MAQKIEENQVVLLPDRIIRKEGTHYYLTVPQNLVDDILFSHKKSGNVYCAILIDKENIELETKEDQDRIIELIKKRFEKYSLNESKKTSIKQLNLNKTTNLNKEQGDNIADIIDTLRESRKAFKPHTSEYNKITMQICYYNKLLGVKTYSKRVKRDDL